MRRVIAYIPDLFFAARLTETARSAGVELRLVQPAAAGTGESSTERMILACATERPDLVILDLHAPDAIAIASALGEREATAHLDVMGFYSHVDHALRAQALAAGVDPVMPRSAFTRALPDLLSAGH